MSEYLDLKEKYSENNVSKIGMHGAGTFEADPKRLAFVLSRYKFVSKMIFGKSNVLEIGAGDAWASRIVKQTVSRLTAIDVDEVFVNNAMHVMSSSWPITVELHDMTKPYKESFFDAIYGLDILEHIDPELEDSFLKNVTEIMTPSGIAIFGMPSIESQKFSNPDNGHVNCKTGEEFRVTMLQYFQNVFMFSMNDEVVHTGFFPMANYLFAIGVGLKELN